jgi:peptide/nickel transport system permease protein
MLTYTIRRLLLSIPTLLFIAFVIFMLLELAPGDPMAQMPLTIPPEVKEKMRLALGLGEPWYVRFPLWLNQFFIVEPQYWIDSIFGTNFADGAQRIISAYKQYSVFDQAGTFVSMIGFSVPPFFSGGLLIVIFSVQLGWLPSIYDTTHQVVDWETFKFQLQQMIMPVMVLALQTTAQVSRYMRASMLDNLGQDYVRTARAKGMSESVVVMRHVLRNSMIPVVTVIALGIPSIFGGAIITEQIFKVNGLGQLLILALQGSDIPMVMTITFLLAVLIVLMNLIADVLYGVLDPRIRYD